MRIITPLLFLAGVMGAYAQPVETVVQRGHELSVLRVVASRDSSFVITASKDKTARLWEMSRRREVRSFPGHEASVTSLAVSADWNLLLTGSNDKQVKLWRIESGEEIFSTLTTDYITDVAIDPANRFFIYAGYNDTGRGDTAVVRDLNSKKVLAKIPVNPDKGLGTGVRIAISPDGKWLAFGEDNRKVSLYSTQDWTVRHVFQYPEGYCGGCGADMVFTSDSRRIIVAFRHGTVKEYSLNDFAEKRHYLDNLDELSEIALGPDNKLLALASANEIQVLKTSNGAVVSRLPAEEKGKFHGIAFSGNGTLIVASDDNTAIVWRPMQDVKEKPFSGFLNMVDKGGLNYDPNFYWQSHIAKYVRLKNKLLIARDGKSLIKGKFGTRIRQWDMATGRTVMEYSGHKKAVLAYDLSRDGSKLISGGGDGKIILWDANTGDSLRVIQAYREPIFDIQFSSDESKVVSSSWDGTMKIHDLASGKMQSYFNLENASAYCLALHPSDLYTITGRLDNSLQMWENDTRTVVRTFIGHTDVVSSARVSVDQKTLLTGSWDGSVRLWDIGTGLMKRKLVHSKTPVHVAVFDSDEKHIYSAGADRVIRVWDSNSFRQIRSFEGHNAEITSLVFSPDNRMLISHSVDGVTKFWDLASGKEFFEHIHLGDKDWLVKNRDGYFNGTDGARQYIHFVSGSKTYAVDQFFNDFFRPDLLPRIFQSRGGDDLKGVHGRLRNSPPPVLKIAAVPVDETRSEILVRMIDSGSGVSGLTLLHNGKSLALNGKEIKYPSGKGEQSTFKVVVDLVGGTNTFTAVAANKDRVESDPVSVDIFSESGVRHSNCHILAVGINEYRNQKLNLNYAKPDAVSFTEVMKNFAGPLFREVFVHTLYDTDATREKILSKMDELSNEVRPEDVFVLYYAGHGSMVDNKFYFIPTENSRLYDAAGLKKEAIEALVLQEKLKNVKALKQLIIMDACQSGGSVELLAVRGANEEKAIAQLSRSTGIHVLASAGSEQFAAEFSELGHGLFTYVLIRALNGEADGAPRDGKVTIYELKSFIDDQVPEMTRKLKGKPQYPYTFSRGQDFPVVIKP